MPYQLREGLSLCRVDSHLVFMDVRSDRYFCLPEATEREIVAYIDDSEVPGPRLDELLTMSILVETEADNLAPCDPMVGPPSRSVVEDESETRTVGIGTCIEVLAIVCWTQLQLKTRRFQNVVYGLASKRQRLTERRHSGDSTVAEGDLVKAAKQFIDARRYVPLEASCLLDSLSLVKFLARRRLPANIIFGVTLGPFSAHCWVQSGDLALNETVSDANAHTPILVV